MHVGFLDRTANGVSSTQVKVFDLKQEITVGNIGIKVA
jgi:hypothetical protein